MPPTDARLLQIVERLKRDLARLDVKMPAERIEDTTLLFEGGLGLDSFAIIELIGVVEASFSFEVPEADLRPDCFVDVITLGRVIARNAPGPV